MVFSNLSVQQRNVSLADPDARFNIDNDDTAFVTIVTRNSSVGKSEGNPGPVPTFEFDVKVDKAVDTTFTVDVATASGTATGGEDYVVKVAGINFAGTVNEVHTFTVTGIADTKLELNEVFYSEIQNNIQASGRDVRVGNPSSAGATILNDDEQSVLSISGNSVAEGDPNDTNQMTFTLTLSQAVDHDIIVSVRVYDITATGAGPNRDYIPTAGGQVVVTIPAGQLSATFTVTLVGDLRTEANEFIGAEILDIDSGDFDVIAATQTEAQRRGTILDEGTDYIP